MQDGLYVALSSQIALERQLNTIADNVANMSTAGFRATKVRFDEMLNSIASNSTSFVSSGDAYLSTRTGPMDETGNPLDFAIEGDAWFAIQTPAGTAVTRDGRFKMTEEGELISAEGHLVLDPGGAPIQLDRNAGTPVVGRDGFVFQDGFQRGAIGLYSYQPDANFQRVGNSAILAGDAAEPIVDRSDIGVVQGFVEQSNVNPVHELSKLILVQRTFDQVAALVRDSEDSFDNAIKTLGAES